MAASQRSRLEPRKRPVQQRSAVTVDALFEASIQVLLAVGYRKLTTTRVAERAGVSVGTLYQYFPNRQALMVAVIERYLNEISMSVEQSCAALHGCKLETMATGLVDGFIAAKWKRLDVSRAMQEPLADVDGARLIRIAAARGAKSVAALLASCRNAAFEEVQPLSLFVVTACSSLLQAAMSDHAQSIKRDDLRRQMRAMILGYLKEARSLKRV
ncbi:TetR/AcrR family transcriptional regulator [Bradyrhizobium sp. Ce-3]|uniref:TetR/AcrR family transcriptional regulator n=1 Tax=Bradyrhizobium sp. Ce-3 TaxID=2913970 RepID=UPI001FBB7D3B|nr:TetR/AcrR family transcriptional regulator [Bradyrhizobium sp. Ce-3]GKQ50192.1 TetR family transcriptional regulator [Bradyrhizobium sp. Ce-3]